MICRLGDLFSICVRLASEHGDCTGLSTERMKAFRNKPGCVSNNKEFKRALIRIIKYFFT